MNRLYIKLGLIIVLLTATGCFNSESEYDQIMEQRDEYARQLAAAKEENEILKQSLANITAEQERLQTALTVERNRLAASAAPLSTGNVSVPAASAGASSAADSDDIWVEAPARLETTARQEAPAQQAQPSAASSGRVYVVKPGDVLYNIAARNNTTVEAILELNPKIRDRRNHMIHEKEKIQLP